MRITTYGVWTGLIFLSPRIRVVVVINEAKREQSCSRGGIRFTNANWVVGGN